MRILETEAGYWGVGKGEFLTMLFRRDMGWLNFERSKYAPAYRFSKKDLTETNRYAWYVPNRDVPGLEHDRRKWGGMSASSWACNALGLWIGREGLPGEMEEHFEKLIDIQGRAIPDERSPAEPYWGLFEVRTDGKPTGRLWSAEPGEIVLFETKKEAQQVLKQIGSPNEEPGIPEYPELKWSVRGLPKAFFKRLGSDPKIKLFIGTVRGDGRLGARPL
jgi:hypothetical protein